MGLSSGSLPSDGGLGEETRDQGPDSGGHPRHGHRSLGGPSRLPWGSGVRSLGFVGRFEEPFHRYRHGYGDVTHEAGCLQQALFSR